MPIKNLFISRSLSKDSSIIKWCNEKNVILTAESMISIEFLDFDLPQSDWYFFSSKNGVRGFFKNNGEIPESIKIGVIGYSTKEELESFGYTADFIGKGTDTVEIGRDFAEVLGEDTVTFCSNNITLGTVSEATAEKQKTNLQSYRTELKPRDFEKQFDILVFTSPSNVNSYFKLNAFSNELLIAIGNTTKKSIQSILGEVQVYIPNDFSEEAIVQLLDNISE